jgi:phosphoribosyl-AMP cyclohydrolase / phosphoribosyl-ATP pyrophosphohydrolase
MSLTPDPSSTAEAQIQALLSAMKLDDAGLIPVIAQDATSGVVRMFAWANQEALRATLTTGDATFWSRSRRALWRKGEESGNVMPVRELRIDCDGDVLLYLCDPVGPSCHTGKTSCFFRTTAAGALAGAEPGLSEDDGPSGISTAILARLTQVIKRRRLEPPEKSYVSSLLTKGFPKINAKILEEAGEVTDALPTGDKPHIAHEAADVLFHLLVGLEAADVPLDDVLEELRRRFGIGGHAEKASRSASAIAPVDRKG